MNPKLETWAAAIVDAMTLEGGGRKGAKASARRHRVSEGSVWRWKKQMEDDPALRALVSYKLEMIANESRPPSAILEKPVQPGVSEVLAQARAALYKTAETLEAINRKALTALTVGDRVEAELLEAIRSDNGNAGVWMELLERLTFILQRDLSPEFLEAIARLADSTTDAYQALAGIDMATTNSQEYLAILRQMYVKPEPKKLEAPDQPTKLN